MKIECEVIEVSTNGETLIVTLQGSTSNSASWRSMGRQVVAIPDTKSACRTFYLGRKVDITVTPK